MPSDCCVPDCPNRRGGHKFPTTPERNLQWRIAIRRVCPGTKKLWRPSDSHVVCRDHFRDEDYLKGKIRRLKRGAVPSKFPYRKSKEARDDTLIASPGEDSPSTSQKTMHFPSIKYCLSSKRHSIHNFSKQSDQVQYLTGFEDYQHFMLFFGILMDTGIKPEQRPEFNALYLEDQMFLMLMKLRQDCDYQCLATLFQLSDVTVPKMFKAWIKFTYCCLKVLHIWPSKKIIQETMSTACKKKHPNARIIVDSVEFPIESRPADINLRRQTFSSYKNTCTVKAIIGVTPRGLVSFVSECFGGAVSERDIIEQSDLYVNASTLFHPGDSILADRGFLFQDLFAPFDVTVRSRSWLKGKSQQYEPSTSYAGQKVALQAEKVIGQVKKTFKLLRSPMPSSLVPLSNMIVYVCFFLSNYRRPLAPQ